jgi:hypothetical protein
MEATATLHDGTKVRGRLTTDHAASSYGQPVFVDDAGQAYDWFTIADISTQSEERKMHKMKLVNLTPHAIVLRDEAGEDHTIPPSGRVARVRTIPGTPEMVPGIPVPINGADQFGAVEGLPEHVEEGVLYVVSLAVGQALVATGHPVARQCVRPGTGPADGPIREGGQIVAVTRLVRVA